MPNDFGRIPSTNFPYSYPGPTSATVLPWLFVNGPQLTIQTNPTFQDSPAISGASGVENYNWGNCSVVLPQSFTPGGIQVAMADGSVRSISPSVSYSAWTAAITPNGNEVIDDSFNE